jgi:hypothetical protein
VFEVRRPAYGVPDGEHAKTERVVNLRRGNVHGGLDAPLPREGCKMIGPLSNECRTLLKDVHTVGHHGVLVQARDRLIAQVPDAKALVSVTTGDDVDDLGQLYAVPVVDHGDEVA